jgi:uncharacterized protein
MPTEATPVRLGERIASIDVLRGVALLGILLLNVRTFALPSAAYASPAVAGGQTPADTLAFTAVQIFADQKFMAIFSLLFGAGLIIFTSRAEARTGHSGGLHYRRMAWLLLIGLCHAWLLWWGDILVGYALCGMVVYPLRHCRPCVQAMMGGGLLIIGSLIWFGMGATVTFGGDEAIAAVKALSTPSVETLADEHAAWTGGWLKQGPMRMELAATLETFIFLAWVMWRAGGLMLIGMACFTWGVFDTRRRPRMHVLVAVAGFGMGLPLVWYGFSVQEACGWSGIDAAFANTLWNYWGSIGVAAGWVGVVMLLCRIDIAAMVRAALACVGRMALSNYLAQSLLCGVIFYGWGLGYYGHFGYAGQLLIVAGIWLAQLIWSPLWLSVFRFGPMEWLWRSLSYWRLQPMTRPPVHSST